MGRMCCVQSCTTRKGRMFSIPRDPKRSQQWMEKLWTVNGEMWNPKSRSSVCFLHFDDSQYERVRDDGSKRLKWSAVPTIFPRINSEVPPKDKILEAEHNYHRPNILRKGGEPGSADGIHSCNHSGSSGGTSSKSTSMLSVERTANISPKSNNLNVLRPKTVLDSKSILEFKTVPIPKLKKESNDLPSNDSKVATIPKPVYLCNLNSEDALPKQPIFLLVPEPKLSGEGVSANLDPASSCSEVNAKNTCSGNFHSLHAEIELLKNREAITQETNAKLLKENEMLKDRLERLDKLAMKLCRRSNELNRKLGAERSNNSRLRKSQYEIEEKLKSVFNTDQLKALSTKSTRGVKWLPSTLQDCLGVRKTFGTKYYNELRKRFPLPSIRTLQRESKGVGLEAEPSEFSEVQTASSEQNEEND